MNAPAALIELHKKAAQAEAYLAEPWTYPGRTPSTGVLKAASTRANNRLVRAAQAHVGGDTQAAIDLMRAIALAA